MYIHVYEILLVLNYIVENIYILIITPITSNSYYYYNYSK